MGHAGIVGQRAADGHPGITCRGQHRLARREKPARRIHGELVGVIADVDGMPDIGGMRGPGICALLFAHKSPLPRGEPNSPLPSYRLASRRGGLQARRVTQ